MSLNLDLVGKSSAPTTYTYSWRNTVLYALGVGQKVPDELDVLFEMQGPKVLPTFAVVPSFTAMLEVCSKLGANMAMVVRGKQTIRLHRPIPPRVARSQRLRSSPAFTTKAKAQLPWSKQKP